MLIVIPAGAAAAPEGPVSGDLRFASLTFQGLEYTLEAASFAALRVAATPEMDPTTFAWTVSAEDLIVNWTLRTFVQTGRPTDPSSGGPESAVGSPSMAEEHLGPATAIAEGENVGSNILVHPHMGENLTARARGGPAQVRPAPGGQWSPGDPGAASATASADDSGYAFVVPPKMTLTESQARVVEVVGNFSVYVWGDDVTAENTSGTHEYRSGSWRSTQPLPPGGAWLRQDQMLRLDVLNGVLRIELDGRSVAFVASESRSQGEVTATFADASGGLVLAGRSQELTSEPFTVVGMGTVTARNDTEDAYLRGRVQLVDGASHAGPGQSQPLMVAPVAMPDAAVPETGSSWLWWLVAGGIGLLVALGSVARNLLLLKPDVLDVEWAMLAGKPRRAHWWAHRLVRREPGNPDALFLLGSLMMSRQQFAAVLSDLEPLAKKVPLTLRSGIAYLLAVSAQHVGDGIRYRRWAAEASKEPDLRSLLADAAPRLAAAPVDVGRPDPAYA